MDLLYASKVCSQRKFQEVFESTSVKPGQSIQKYHRLMLDGLRKNLGDSINVMAAIPVSRRSSKQLYFRGDQEYYDGITYSYLPFINIPVFRQLFLSVSGLIHVVFWLQRHPQSVVICDVLDVSISIVSLIASKATGHKSVGIVTDVPTIRPKEENRTDNLIKKAIARTNMYILSKFDAYVFLTDQMNELINEDNKPYVVMEGHVDTNMADIINLIENKYPLRTIMYTGALKEVYGLKLLVDAFLAANLDDTELHLYGSGDFERELRSICAENHNIKYFGTVPNETAVKAQMRATLLVNPRFTDGEYTKYSFPSKNMEYMVSGTPVLTTRLPGMPKEYYDYVYLIENETVDGLAQTLKMIWAKPAEELHQKGQEAKQFVLENKNNYVQAGRVFQMLQFINSSGNIE